MSGPVRVAVGVALAIGVIGVEVPNGATSAPEGEPMPMRLLVTGTFHGDEVTARSGEVWMGLFPTANGYALRATTLTVKTVRDEIVDIDDRDPPTGKEVAVSDARTPLFLVKANAAGRLRPRAVPTVFAGELYLTRDAQVRLTTWTGEYVLTVDSHPSPASPAGGDQSSTPADRHQFWPAGLAQHSTLTLHIGGITQTLYSMTEHDAAAWQLLWAGDLDGDGKLDLLLDLNSHSNSGARRLFLSSAARKGEAVREVAVLETVGC